MKNKYLEGCTVYCTCEPCIMCLSAMIFAKADRVVYGLSLKDMFPNGELSSIDIDSFLTKASHQIKLSKNFMKEECSKLI